MRVFILAGGRGTRLKSVFSGPKVLFPINGLTLLERQVNRLLEHGFLDIRLVLADQAQAVLDFIHAKQLPCRAIVTSGYGTGGDLKIATRNMDEHFLVLNGDTLTDIHWRALARYGQQRVPQDSALATIINTGNVADYGSITIDPEQNRITGFQEKTGEQRPGLINAGAYVFGPETLKALPESCSLEKDCLPSLAAAGKLHYRLHDGYLFDCGTPQRVDAAEQFFRLG